MQPRIVVGIDGSDRGLEALGLARLLASASGARLVLAAVHGYDVGPDAGATVTLLRENAERRLDDAELALAGAPEWDRRLVVATSPAEGLHDLAKHEPAALIVVGSSHRGTVGRVLPGSVGERLLHGAPCPVAVAPRGYAAPALEDVALVGAAFNERPESWRALAEAGDWARRLGARLQVVTVLDPPRPAHPEFALHSYHAYLEEARRSRRAAVEDAASTFCRRADARMLEGHAAERLVELSHGLDLLVLGSRGYGPMGRVLRGGVSGAVLQAASCPVMVVPRRAAQESDGEAAVAAEPGLSAR